MIGSNLEGKNAITLLQVLPVMLYFASCWDNLISISFFEMPLLLDDSKSTMTSLVPLPWTLLW